jgi:hypothetical protein
VKRPARPDYQRIYELEQEIYGEAFDHAGSPVILVGPRRLSFVSALNIEHTVAVARLRSGA